MDENKRTSKVAAVEFIISNFGMVQAGIFTEEAIKTAFKKGNYYLYKEEIQKLIEDPKGRIKDPKAFVNFLKNTEAVREGAAPSMTDGLVRINSKERALEVANNPQNEAEVKAIMEITSSMLKLRDQLNPLINTKATCSIALKNKGKKDEKDAPAEGELPQSNG